jgi:hypothetical protein
MGRSPIPVKKGNAELRSGETENVASDWIHLAVEPPAAFYIAPLVEDRFRSWISAVVPDEGFCKVMSERRTL